MSNFSYLNYQNNNEINNENNSQVNQLITLRNVSGLPVIESISSDIFFQELSNVNNEELESRINRNYEVLIAERNQELSENTELITNNLYNKIFNEIKNKLLIISDDNTETISESIKKDFLESHNLMGIQEVINKLKKVIVEIHNKKIELDITRNEACLKFKKFSDLVIATVNIIKESSEPDDKKLSELLMDKIGRYFLLLDLENLNNSVNSVNKEYLSIKQLFLELSGMIPATVCQICLENQINFFMDPCGHTICTYCKEKRPGLQKCHFCRSNISTFKRLYL
jgi:hypothetical protein